MDYSSELLENLVHTLPGALPLATDDGDPTWEGAHARAGFCPDQGKAHPHATMEPSPGEPWSSLSSPTLTGLDPQTQFLSSTG